MFLTGSTNAVPLESTLVVDMLTQHVEGHAQEKGYLDANWSHTSELLRNFTARKAAQAEAIRLQAEANHAAHTGERQAAPAVSREAQEEQVLAEQGVLPPRSVGPAAGASRTHLAIAVGAVGVPTGGDAEARGLAAASRGAPSPQLQRRVQLAGVSGRSLAGAGGSSGGTGGRGGGGVTWQDPGEQGVAAGGDGGGEGSGSGQASSRSTSGGRLSGVDAVCLDGLLQSVLQRSQSVQLRLAESCALKEEESGEEGEEDGQRFEAAEGGDAGAHAATRRQQQHQDHQQQRSQPLQQQHQELNPQGDIRGSSSSKDSSSYSSSHKGHVHPSGFNSHGRGDGSTVGSGRGHRPDRSPSHHRCHSAASSAHRGGTTSSRRRRRPDPGVAPRASTPDAARAGGLQDITGGACGAGTVGVEASAEPRGPLDGCDMGDGATAWTAASAPPAACAPSPCNCACSCHNQHGSDPQAGDVVADKLIRRESRPTDQQDHADLAGRSPLTASSARAASPRRSLPLWAPARPHSRSFCHSPEPAAQPPSPSWAARAAAARTAASGVAPTTASRSGTPTREVDDGMARACSLPAPGKGPAAVWRCSQSPPPGPLSAGPAFAAGPGPREVSQGVTPQPHSPVRRYGAQEVLQCNSGGAEVPQLPESSLVADGCSPMRSRRAVRARAEAGGGAGGSPAAEGEAAEVQAASLLPTIGSSGGASSVLEQQQHQHLPKQTNSPSRGCVSSGAPRALSPGRAMGKSAWARNSVPRELTFLRF